MKTYIENGIIYAVINNEKYVVFMPEECSDYCEKPSEKCKQCGLSCAVCFFMAKAWG